jgi:hypothetical protein
VHDLASRAANIGWIPNSGSHDEIGRGTINRAGFLTRFLFAIFTTPELCLELCHGHNEGIDQCIIHIEPLYLMRMDLKVLYPF